MLDPKGLKLSSSYTPARSSSLSKPRGSAVVDWPAWTIWFRLKSGAALMTVERSTEYLSVYSSRLIPKLRLIGIPYIVRH